MRIAHLGDVHLGFRAYAAKTDTGMNQREADVVLAFRFVIEDLLRWKPDLVIIPGDLFDSPDPSMAVMAEAQRQLQKLDCPIVLCGGNHDHPRVASEGHPFWPLAEALDDAHVVVGEPAILDLRIPTPTSHRHRMVMVLVLPHGTYSAQRILEYATTARAMHDADHQILVVHAPIEVRGEDRLLYARMSDESIPAEILRPADWTYVAAGDFHEFLAFAPNACYSGSIEYVGGGPWREARADAPRKGYVRFDTETRQLTHVEVPTRIVLDLPIIEGARSATELLDAMRDNVGSVRGGRIIRQRVSGVAPEVWATLDWSEIAERELYYYAELVAAAPAAGGVPMVAVNGKRTLTEEMDSFMSTWEPGTGIERDGVRTYAAECIEEAKNATGEVSGD